jgi:hypothetical protein
LTLSSTRTQHTNTYKPGTHHTSTHKHTQTHSNTLKRTQTHSKQHKHSQKPLKTSPPTYRSAAKSDVKCHRPHISAAAPPKTPSPPSPSWISFRYTVQHAMSGPSFRQGAVPTPASASDSPGHSSPESFDIEEDHQAQSSPHWPTPGQASPASASKPPRIPPPLQKRRRVTRACDECRRKKIKCDGKQPCTHCTVYSYGMAGLYLYLYSRRRGSLQLAQTSNVLGSDRYID